MSTPSLLLLPSRVKNIIIANNTNDDDNAMMMIPQSDDIDNVPRFWVTPLLIRREERERERERVIYKIRYFGEIFLLLWSLVLKKFLVCVMCAIIIYFPSLFPLSL